ncbi:MAG: helix-turn-helix domain-containing protein [Clostridiales bacterium]|nr:helix-turn-helix domain-containing protein [Clostridiales bacterium]
MIERADHRGGFTVIDNGLLRDVRLSLKAKGLLCIMLSMSDSWEFSMRGLCDVSGVGVDGISALLKELERCGYVTRERARRADGTFGKYLYTARELPKREAPERENACPGETPEREKACPGENPPVRNTKDVRNTKAVRKGGAFAPPTAEQVRQYCAEHAYAIDPERFVDYYEARGWMLGKTGMKSWQAAVRNWSRRERTAGRTEPVSFDSVDGWEE